MAAKKVYKLNLWTTLDNISLKNVKYYDTLSEEDLKELNSYLMMRWLSGANDPRQITFLNGFLNPYVWHFDTKDHRHKKLLYYLMTVCTSNKKYRYKFNKTVPKKQRAMPKATGVIQKVFDYNSKDAFDAISILTDEAILDMAEQLGKQDAEIKELKKELKSKRPR